MLERLLPLYYLKEEGTSPRFLKENEKAPAIEVLSTYFLESKEELEDFVDNIEIVPSEINGSTFFTDKSYKEMVRTYTKDNGGDYYLINAKAEYICNLLGIKILKNNSKDCSDEFWKIVDRINAVDKKGKPKSGDVKYTKQDLERAREFERIALIDYENNERSDSNGGYSSKDEDVYAEKYEDAQNERIKIEEYLNSSAIEIYKENHKTVDKMAENNMDKG